MVEPRRDALKLVKSDGETAVTNGRRSRVVISEMPMLATKVTAIRRRH